MGIPSHNQTSRGNPWAIFPWFSHWNAGWVRGVLGISQKGRSKVPAKHRKSCVAVPQVPGLDVAFAPRCGFVSEAANKGILVNLSLQCVINGNANAYALWGFLNSSMWYVYYVWINCNDLNMCQSKKTRWFQQRQLRIEGASCSPTELLRHLRWKVWLLAARCSMRAACDRTQFDIAEPTKMVHIPYIPWCHLPARNFRRLFGCG